ncbi:Argininosuccinate lyase [Fundidesulfovibrio magnetotacticus]|uniref:Argininosuccinate lyase n=1 Tax=Fundidesulfovibrio magnetotacticus TaxID=2730080 RepID=A0A6V8LRK2_9BACT|nr:argininosuccinate lyase [Fundidesulfovibrio magnetotacticus]GFK95112.1 Argininosuccinate lyase [Fundidesulfovibrio magnetotacticus]
MSTSSKPWGGRFAEPTSKIVERYTGSVRYDKALYAQDIAGSKAHARMLSRQGIIGQEDANKIVAGLDLVLGEIHAGTFQWKESLEDVHMNIEARLTELIGEPGKKLHTGRSRNDQVCLDFRLFVSARLEVWSELLAALVKVLAGRAGEHAETLLPGTTHLQPAQPVSLGHHLLAYAWMFRRDHERCRDALKRAAVSPLGAAALAGTTFPLDPASVAEELQLNGTFRNSLDAVSDRDFALEALFVGTTVMMHLSRLCEELILWANPNFGYVALPDAYATGSSIMPQKKNPDVAELMRGKTGRVYGALFTLMTIMKGLPLAYNRDMQEDKEPFFDADRTVSDSLAIMAEMMQAMGFRPEKMRQALKLGFLNATELADYLAARGVPFREAHHVAGSAVALAEKSGRGLEDLSLEELRGLCDKIGPDVAEVLQYETAVKRRDTPGGTAPERVEEQIAALEKWLLELEKGA